MSEAMDGCDGGDPGSAESPSIWLFGIEPGWSKADQESDRPGAANSDGTYSIQAQLAWPYNRNAFKLLAAIHGMPARDYRDFAFVHQPFTKGCKGFFKGNIYPYACHHVGTWDESTAKEAGFEDKASYMNVTRSDRFPKVRGWVIRHRPKLILAVGNSYRNDFAQAFLGEVVKFSNHTFAVNGHTKKLFYNCDSDSRLVVIPHLSGGKNGLNSDAAIEMAGEFIANILPNLK